MAKIEAALYIYHTLKLEDNKPFAQFLNLSKDFLERRNLDQNRIITEEV